MWRDVAVNTGSLVISTGGRQGFTKDKTEGSRMGRGDMRSNPVFTTQSYLLSKPWSAGMCGYACSDHASWDKEGYSAAFPFETPMEELNPRIHSENDSVSDYLDEKFGLNFAKLALAFALELAWND